MTSSKRLSVVLATHNEEANLRATLASIQDLADEIVVVDGQSTDQTVAIAKEFGAQVKIVPNRKMFHINKQIATDMASGEWILELDADEIVTPQLAEEIQSVINGTHVEPDLQKEKLFRIHQQNIAARDHVTYSQQSPIHGYFIARKNFFLGSYLLHSGVYPDGVIRLVKRGTAHFPCKSVHEQMSVQGGVSWLREPMIHMADPTFRRYLERANRYTTLTALEFENRHLPITVTSHVRYFFIKPLETFLILFFRHKGFLDGFSGFVWAVMSGLHHPMAYMKYLHMQSTKKSYGE
jgi:glycosyltransferase involved in cell wall biosynthesis